MSEIASTLIAWLGPELAATVLSAALVVGLGFLVYGGTCAALWLGCLVYRLVCLGARRLPAPPMLIPGPHDDAMAAALRGESLEQFRARREGFQRAGLRHEPGKPAAGGADRV